MENKTPTPEIDSSQTKPGPNNAPEAPIPERPKSKKWLAVSGVLALVIAIGLVSWFLAKGTGSGTGNTTNSNVAHHAAATAKSDDSTVQTASIPAAIDPVNPAAIPLGTGKVSTTPQVGYVDFCNNKSSSVAAEPSLPWIDTATNTWDSETKPAVEGSVSWASSAYYTDTISGTTRTITTNDLPINHDTGTFPIGLSDPAHQYDGNPNHIAAQPTTWALSANPTAASSPGCTTDGPVGILNDGVFLFNALDAQNRDAGATEILDQWQGHPDSSDMYHHHTVPTFMLDEDSAKSSSTLIGYAVDGYGIYIERDANGNLLTNANLDACHGRTSEVMWNGKMTDIYHYDATLEYPYTVGCFHGTPIKTNMQMNMNMSSKP